MISASLLLMFPQTGFSIASTKSIPGLGAVSVAAAPAGGRVAIGCENGMIRIVDANTRQTLRTLTGHPQAPQALAWSTDGKILASGDESARIFLWNTKTWTRREFRPHTKPIQFLSFNAKGTMLVSTGQDDNVKVWSMGSFQKPKLDYFGKGANLFGARFIGKTDGIALATLTTAARGISTAGVAKMSYVGHGSLGINDIDVNATGGRLVTAGRDNAIGLFETKTGKRLGYFRGHTDWVQRVLFSPSGKWLASSSSDGSVKIWHPGNFKMVAEITSQKGVGSPLAFTGDGKFFVTVNAFDNPEFHRIGK